MGFWVGPFVVPGRVINVLREEICITQEKHIHSKFKVQFLITEIYVSS